MAWKVDRCKCGKCVECYRRRKNRENMTKKRRALGTPVKCQDRMGESVRLSLTPEDIFGQSGSAH